MGGVYVNGLQSNPAYIVAFNPGTKSRCALRTVCPLRLRDPGTLRQVPCLVASFSISTQPPFCQAISQWDSNMYYKSVYFSNDEESRRVYMCRSLLPGSRHIRSHCGHDVASSILNVIIPRTFSSRCQSRLMRA